MDQNRTATQPAQLQRSFSLAQFQSVVEHLLDTMQMTINFSVEDLYNQIQDKHGKVSGKDIMELIHAFKSEVEFEKQIDAQVQFYLATIQALKNNNKSTLSKDQFFTHFAINNPKQGVVTEEIQSQIAQLKSVQICKLQTLIETIQSTRTQHRVIRSNESAKTNLCRQQNTQDSINSFSNIEAVNILRNLIIQNVRDESVRQSSLLLLDKINIKLIQKEDNDISIQNTQHSYEEDHQKCNEQMSKLEHIIQQKNDTISTLYQINQKYEEEIRLFESKCQQDFVDAISELQQKNQQLSHQNDKIIYYCHQLEKQIQCIKNGERAHDQLEKVQQKLEKKQFYFPKLFKQEKFKEDDQLILKEKFTQCCQKMNKLRKENQKLKIRISDLQTQIQAKAIYSNNQTQRSNRNIPHQKLSSQFTHELAAAETFLRNLRKQSNASDHAQSKQLYNSLSQSKSRRLIKQLTCEYFNTENNNFNFQLHQIEEVLDEQNQKYKINEFDFMGYLKTQKLIKDLTLFLQTQPSNSKIINTIFSSWIHIMSCNGNITKFGLVISSQKLLFLTPQWKTKFVIQFSNLSEMCFCSSHKNLIVLNLKQSNLKMNGKPVSNIVIHINNRMQLLRYLLKYVFASGFLNKLNITFKKSQNIQIIQQQKLIALSNFNCMRNSIQMSICDGLNVFQVKFKQSSIFSRQVNGIVVVNSIGILIFQKGKKYLFQKIQKQQKLKCILPWVQQMDIIDLSQQNKIKIVYPSSQKSYILQLENYALSKSLQEKLRTKKCQNQKLKKQESEKYTSLFHNFRKMRSINEQLSSSLATE